MGGEKITDGSLLAFNLLIKRKYIFWKLLCISVLLTFLGLKLASYFSKNSGNYIAKVVLDMVIVSDSEILQNLEKIKNDKKIKAVIFTINSPGGTITGSEMLYNAILQISSVKPTAAIILDIGASGSYMASIATHYIIAQNTSMVGSIGVLMEYWNVEEVAKKLGLKRESFKTSDFKAAPSPYYSSTPEVKEYLNQMLNEGYEFFASLVANRRGKKIANLDAVINGKVFSGKTALKLGLIDKIGGEPEAINFFHSVAKLSDAKTLEVREYKIKEREKSHGLLSSFFSSAISSVLLSVFGGSSYKAYPTLQTSLQINQPQQTFLAKM